MMFVLRSTPNHTPFKYRCPLEKNNKVTHIVDTSDLRPKKFQKGSNSWVS
jgi:hypothetical protein